MRRVAFLPLVVPAFAACAGDAPPQSVIVRDSAGVRIVESHAPAWGPGREWRLSEEPALSIGVADGEPEYELFGVTGVVRLSDGSLVVASEAQTSADLRFFDAEGRHVRTVGRKGGAPDEFQSIIDVYRLPGDTIVVNDAFRTLRFFDAEGEFIEVHEVRDAFLGGAFADGTFVDRNSTRERGNGVTGQVEFLRVSRTSEVLARTPSLDSRPAERTGFEPELWHAVGGDLLFAGYAARFEIRAFGTGGQLRTILRPGVEPQPVTEELIERIRTEYAALATEDYARRARERELSTMTFPAIMPAFDRMLADREGNLWVRLHDWRRGDVDPGLESTYDFDAHWTVLDAEGRWLGDVVMPARFVPMEIGADWVAGFGRDALDVEYVRVYPLEKPQPSR